MSVKLWWLTGEDAYNSYNAVFTLLDDETIFDSQTKKFAPHQVQSKIILDSLSDSKHWPHFTYRYADKQSQWVRLQLHPKDMGLDGFEELHSILGQFTEDGWGSFVRRAKVTQIEVTIDLHGIPFNTVHVLPDQAQTFTTYKSGKQVETTYFGKSKSNQTMIYDRAAKRAKSGQHDKTDPCTRIERKKSSPNRLIKDLGSMANQFTHVKFVDVPPVPPKSEKKDYMWTLFTDSVAQRGLEPALKLLPQAKRTSYRKHISNFEKNWWMPKAIWTAWPEVLENLKLTAPDYWKGPGQN